eukprot:365262-Chlamydomonas_euryale.AAC.10
MEVMGFDARWLEGAKICLVLVEVFKRLDIKVLLHRGIATLTRRQQRGAAPSRCGAIEVWRHRGVAASRSGYVEVWRRRHVATSRCGDVDMWRRRGVATLRSGGVEVWPRRAWRHTVRPMHVSQGI